jgi:hypothetical protein
MPLWRVCASVKGEIREGTEGTSVRVKRKRDKRGIERGIEEQGRKAKKV